MWTGDKLLDLQKSTSKPIINDHEDNLMECARPKCPIQTQNPEKKDNIGEG
jgi:hypothetical protein